MIWILVAFVGGIWAGVQLTKLFHEDMVRKILKDAGVSNTDLRRAQEHIRKQIAEENTPREVDIKVEQHSGHYYAFRKSNDEFLGQGEDYVHLLTALQRRLGTNCTVNLDYTVARDIKGSPAVESTRVE